MRSVEKSLRAQVKDLEQQIETLIQDRQKFRDFIVAELRRQLQVIGEQKYWEPKAIVERIMKFMQTVKWWSW